MAQDWTFKQLAAEFVAMILFVWIGTGSALSSVMWTDGVSDTGRLLTIAIAFGFGISVLAYGIGHISGGHINPAVTLSFVAMGDISPMKGLLYMLVQCAGAIVGSFIVWGTATGLIDGCADGAVYPEGVCLASLQPDGGYGPAFAIGLNQVSDRVTLYGAFLLEFMGTYLLVFTVLFSAVHKQSTAGNAAPIAIGWSVMLAHILLIPFTGCGINPARSLGPMVVNTIGGLGSVVWIRGWWVFYTAPFVGSLCATATYKIIFEEKEEEVSAKVEIEVVEEEAVDEAIDSA